MAHPDKYRRIARRVWQQANGRSSRGGHVHHKDHDVTNNDISNLEWLSYKDHKALHPLPREPRVCENCGTAFESITRTGWRPARFCSNSCKSAARRDAGVDDVTRKCAKCGQRFTVNCYSKQRFCSLACTDPGTYERAVRTFTCVECAMPGYTTDSRTMYCSVRCRKRYDRRRAGKTVGTRKPYKKQELR